ncbi:pentapeptide repeat-containing protein [Eggerthella lenta]|uniref:pentapeptide repeat-containing protein n=1 Tax=Eggerthella lenta TaxID=84112 RepID=UPI003983DD3E
MFSGFAMPGILPGASHGCAPPEGDGGARRGGCRHVVGTLHDGGDVTPSSAREPAPCRTAPICTRMLARLRRARLRRARLRRARLRRARLRRARLRHGALPPRPTAAALLRRSSSRLRAGRPGRSRARSLPA